MYLIYAFGSAWPSVAYQMRAGTISQICMAATLDASAVSDAHTIHV